MADSVSYLALQRPVDVTVKLIDSVVQSRGHGDCVVKLLRRLPMLTVLRTSEDRCVMLDRLHQHIIASSEHTLQNITCFSRLILVSTANSSVSHH